jgi:hypothetical protein
MSLLALTYIAIVVIHLFWSLAALWFIYYKVSDIHAEVIKFNRHPPFIFPANLPPEDLARLRKEWNDHYSSGRDIGEPPYWQNPTGSPDNPDRPCGVR